jgi:hypothetical protein
VPSSGVSVLKQIARPSVVVEVAFSPRQVPRDLVLDARHHASKRGGYTTARLGGKALRASRISLILPPAVPPMVGGWRSPLGQQVAAIGTDRVNRFRANHALNT